MYIITNKEGLNCLPLTLNAVKGIIYARLNELLTTYKVNDISSFGAFILLQSAEEIKRYKTIGLTEPITESSVEWVETIKTGNEVYYNLCIVRDDIFAVNIFIPKAITNESIKKIIGGFINENG